MSVLRSVGSVVWITGLSGSGKSTLAAHLRDSLRSVTERLVVLDGDELRGTLSELLPDGDSYHRETRLALAQTYARLSGLLAEQGCLVVVATISLFHEIHRWNREHLPGYVEVFLEVPVSELRTRDPKSIYADSSAGSISNVAGIDLDVEFPLDPHLRFTWEERATPSQMAETVRHYLEKERGL